MSRTLSGLTLFLALVPSIVWAQFTDPQPMQRVMDQYMALLFSREFDRLDSDMDAAKAKNLKTTDGQPMLEFMHIGVSGCACGNLTEELWKVRKQALDEWLKRKPQSLNARLALAAYPLSYGWFRRTIGYANTVSQEAWTAFRKGIQESAAALLALDSEAKSDPRWYVEMLNIGLAAGWPRDRFDAIYQEATARYPDYYMLYFTAGQYYSARWYGSRNGRADQNRLIEQAAARGGDVLYARMMWSTSGDGVLAEGDGTDWNRMRAGFDQIMKQYPDPWNLNNFGRFACQARDWATVRQLIAVIGDKPITKAWHDDIEFFDSCKRESAKYVPRKSPW